MRKASFIVPACVAVATLASLVACTVAPTIPDGLDRGDAVTSKPKKDAGTTATKDGSTSTTPPTTPPGDPTPTPTPTPTPQQGKGACAPSATAQACFECCEAANPNALPILDVEWDKCACSAGKCQAACGTTYCASPRVPGAQGDACDVCLGGADAACLAQMESACRANPTCKPLYTCDEDALCQSKP